jgi:hypothetical protein
MSETGDPNMSLAFDSMHGAFIAGRSLGQQERSNLFRLIAAGVAREYEKAGQADLARAANEVCRLIFGLDMMLWPLTTISVEKSLRDENEMLRKRVSDLQADRMPAGDAPSPPRKDET